MAERPVLDPGDSDRLELIASPRDDSVLQERVSGILVASDGYVSLGSANGRARPVVFPFGTSLTRRHGRFVVEMRGRQIFQGERLEGSGCYTTVAELDLGRELGLPETTEVVLLQMLLVDEVLDEPEVE